METEVGAARAAVGSDEQRRVAQTSCSTRYYLLIVIGDISTDHQLNKVREQIKRGLRSWEIDLTVCDLDNELQLFKAKHSAQFSSEVKGANLLQS